ncbi:MAG: hypothetical protein KJ757_02515 [Planctomycetes bacterium]|nr:hypothetical protein [Planctomycetota bacterium]MBU1518265.1 hypothetical protein [Planctomycetota bacterium]MBU2457020.1 hypothetical protein [Planctomycetota bacterium]MBU2596425.1 hypothetical protein [Planctomycetota bacterium]
MTKQIADELPKPSLEHLERLTDDTGLLQHAKYIIPDRLNGYCTDDNARALIAVTKYLKNHDEPQARKLFDIYLAFLYHSLKPDKTVRNFLDYNRNWRIDEPQHDTLGRAIWAFGTVIASSLNDNYLRFVKEFFTDTSNHIPSLPLRGTAYSIFGLYEFLTKFPKDKQILKLLSIAADNLAKNYNSNSSPEWDWFEDTLSYANAIMPAAMYAAARILNNRTYLDIAEKTCFFLLANTFNGKHFSFIGSSGWYPKGGKRAQFDQQCIEVSTTIIMLANAYQATKNKEYLTLQRKAFNWFLGENDVHHSLYDNETKGCCDGLGSEGVNVNQGAESIISFLLSLLHMEEMT